MEALVTVIRGPEDHFFEDQARLQSRAALEVLGVDSAAIERETIRQVSLNLTPMWSFGSGWELSERFGHNRS